MVIHATSFWKGVENLLGSLNFFFRNFSFGYFRKLINNCTCYLPKEKITGFYNHIIIIVILVLKFITYCTFFASFGQAAAKNPMLMPVQKRNDYDFADFPLKISMQIRQVTHNIYSK